MNRDETVVLTLPFPPSANAIWRTARGKTYLNQEYKNFLSSVVAVVRRAMRVHEPSSELVSVSIELYPSTARRYDVDNRIKPTLDALTKSGVWIDDSQVVTITATKKQVDKKNPRAVVTITTIKENPKEGAK